jgi:pectate lyase
MRLSVGFLVAATLGGVIIATGTTAAHKRRDLGRDVLAPNDGWASDGAGTTGGSAATDDQVYTVTNRRELIAALNNGVPSSTSPSTPSDVAKIIYVVGTIDGNVDDENDPLTCEDYFRRDPTPPPPTPPTDGELFSYEAFQAAFDPATWGRVPPSGPQERARLASQAAQQARVRIRPGSNTTIVGVGDDATIRGVWLDIRGSAAVPRTNIIVRNITFEDTYDCFPAWAPTDGALGAWNSLYDSISLRDTNHVWVDHNTFRDRTTDDETLPLVFGVLFQVHDGLLDITNASDLVTVSWNRFENHDKLMLIGSSDNAPADVGKLRVTLHHNLFDGIGQRAPRVRFGQVHVYNNHYRIDDDDNFQYSWGVGIQSQVYAENNFFEIDRDIPLGTVIERLNGTAMFETGTLVDHTLGHDRGMPHGRAVSLLEEYNAITDPDILDATGTTWQPTLFLEVDRTKKVPNLVRKDAGPFDTSCNSR